ncbi:hypothetical protein C9374_005474 [Naegleria lovaniensis]|uniref:Clp1 P-loop domain-containing protein n=1 Tax=Naegleria lovaniensis TaxID=51637 RepID=A0AA88GPT5_NAELO|nr:uncharacterized protein C9374_005474 [Naegleria lovaniensis]KAG2382272.1 hypothetical protein C9374_005474 [Naegleria lovaniensis]
MAPENMNNPQAPKKPKFSQHKASTASTNVEETFELKYGEGIAFRNEHSTLRLTVKSGCIDIFGTEFKESQFVEFAHPEKSFHVIGLNTHHDGNTLIQIQHSSQDVISLLNDPSYIAFHQGLIEMFENISKQIEHVRLLVVGPTDSGKSTICKILFNHAMFSSSTDLQRICFFSDIDVGQNQVSLPGTMGLSVASSSGSGSIDKESSSMETNSNTSEIVYTKELSVSHQAPLELIPHKHVFYFGDISPKNTIYYNYICQRIYEKYESILQENERVNKSFLVMNTCGWVEGQGYSILLKAIKSCKITHVLSMDEQTFKSLKKDTAESGVEIIYKQKSSQVKKRNTNFRKETRNNSIMSYFSKPLNTLTLSLDDVQMCMLDYKTQTSARALDLSDKSLNRICAISTANSVDQVLNQEIFCFIVLEQFNSEKKTVKLLLPASKDKKEIEKLPKPIFLLSGSVMFK